MKKMKRNKSREEKKNHIELFYRCALAANVCTHNVQCVCAVHICKRYMIVQTMQEKEHDRERGKRALQIALVRFSFSISNVKHIAYMYGYSYARIIYVSE